MPLRLLRDLVAIDSVNPTLVPGAPGEGVIAEFVAAEMRAAGLDVEVTPIAPGRPNVVGILDGAASGRTLMLCGHLDTVGVAGMTDPFTAVERDGRLYGRGAQDMKGGVAAMIAAARRLVAEGGLARGRLIVAAVVDEEHSSIGADALVSRWTADAAVITEPTGLEVAVAHKGFAWIEIAVHGTAAHGSRPAEGEDAILRMGRVLARLEALDRELQRRPPDQWLGTGSLHASTIEGGHELSSYPAHARLVIERRTLPDEDPSVAFEEVQGILGALQEEDPTFRASARTMFGRPGYRLNEGHSLPQTLARIVAQAGGVGRIGATTFWTDAAILGGAGIPTVLFGPGGGGLHSEREYVTLKDVVACCDALVQLARRFC